MARRPKINVLKSDPTYSAGVFGEKPPPAPLPPPKQTRAAPKAPPPEKPVARQEATPAKTSIKVSDDTDRAPAIITADLSARILVKVTLKPRAEHEAELRMLDSAGYQVSKVLAAAIKTMSKGVELSGQYVAPVADDLWAEHSAGYYKRVPLDLLEHIRDDAKDPGALSNAALIRGQVTPVWNAALEALIAKLKAKL
ncbi:MAG: hypothetical protein ACXIUW_11815 [Roseinatronobacter sp.]